MLQSLQRKVPKKNICSRNMCLNKRGQKYHWRIFSLPHFSVLPYSQYLYHHENFSQILDNPFFRHHFIETHDKSSFPEYNFLFSKVSILAWLPKLWNYLKLYFYEDKNSVNSYEEFQGFSKETLPQSYHKCHERNFLIFSFVLQCFKSLNRQHFFFCLLSIPLLNWQIKAWVAF